MRPTAEAGVKRDAACILRSRPASCVSVLMKPSPANYQPLFRTATVGARLSQYRCGTIAFLPHLRCKGVARPLPGSELPAMRSHKNATVCINFGGATGLGSVDTPARKSRPCSRRAQPAVRSVRQSGHA